MSNLRRVLRIVCYTTTLLIHIVTAIDVDNRNLDNVNDIRVNRISKYKYRYYTTWNVMAQISHALIGLLCEFVEIFKIRNERDDFLKRLRHSRNVMFTSIIAPNTLFIFTVFWTIYVLDRELIFPTCLDKYLPLISNHCMHTMILPIVLVEMYLFERKEPKSHRNNCIIIAVFLVAFHLNLFATYIFEDYWLYPIYGKFNIFGLISLTISSFIVTYMFYFSQWYFVKHLWHSERRKNKIY